jgi:hypothetical protein
MAAAHCTNGRRGQKLNAHHISAPRGKLFTPDKKKDGNTKATFLFFSFIFSPFTFLPQM